MRAAVPAVALVLVAAGCGRSGVPGLGDATGSGYPLPQVRDLPEALVWHSWDVEIHDTTSPEQATVLDATGSVKADVELYESSDDLSVAPGPLLGDYAATHQNGPQAAGSIRYEGGGMFPYVGKSLTPRDAAEPPPAGVLDLQLHPPDNDHFIVAAFVAPILGRYVVTDFGAHRFLSDPGASYVAILLGSDPPAASGIESEILFPNDDGVWQAQAGAIDLGALPANERICFAVYRGLIDGSAFGDATEVSFTITRTSN